MVKRLAIGGVGDGRWMDGADEVRYSEELYLPKPGPGGVPPVGEVAVSRYRLASIAIIGDAYVDVWVDEALPAGEVLRLLLEGYRPKETDRGQRA